MTTRVFPDGAAEPVAVPLPDGWVRVWQGRVRVGDRYLNAVLFPAETVWVELTTVPRPGQPYDVAEFFLCLIRPGEEEIGHPCWLCRCRPPMEDARRCYECSLPPR